MKNRFNFFKKEIIISGILVALGFIFEFFFFNTDVMILNVKFWVLGMVCITVGILGLWIYMLIPFMSHIAKKSRKKNSIDN